MDACPNGFFIGVVKIFAFPRPKSGIFDLNLNKNEHFSKVSSIGKDDVRTRKDALINVYELILCSLSIMILGNLNIIRAAV
jgi:hypothetical protein